MKKSWILDTDMGPDCDDTAALALAILYARKAGGRLLGVTHCTSSPWGVGVIRSILKWYNAADIPVGTLEDEDLLRGAAYEKYNRAIAETLPPEDRKAGDALTLCRKLLSEQPDQSVEIIGIGPMRNLNNLLVSSADSISPLSGRELIRQKVSRLTVMAGNFLSTESPAAEWNVEMDIASACQIFQQWPGTIVCCGWEVGAPVMTLPGDCGLKENNPVNRAYRLFCGSKERNSWDLCTVQWAMHPDCNGYSISAPGTITIRPDGVSDWKFAENGKHFYLSLVLPAEQVARQLEEPLLVFEKQKGERAL